MQPSAKSQYSEVASTKAVAASIGTGTKKLVKGMTNAREVKRKYVGNKYGEIRRGAMALKEARGKQEQSLTSREIAKRGEPVGTTTKAGDREKYADLGKAQYAARTKKAAKITRMKQITKNIESNYGQAKSPSRPTTAKATSKPPVTAPKQAAKASPAVSKSQTKPATKKGTTKR